MQARQRRKEIFLLIITVIMLLRKTVVMHLAMVIAGGMLMRVEMLQVVLRYQVGAESKKHDQSICSGADVHG